MRIAPALAVVPAGLPVHGVGNRQDLPLPFAALVTAAVAVLVISFVALAALWRQPRLRPGDGVLLPRWAAVALDSPALRTTARAVTVALTLWVAVALVAGADTARNPVPSVVYVWLWVGVAFTSMALGPVWRVVNPLRLLHAGLLRLARVDPDLALLRYRGGLWPAAAGLAAFTWVELVADDKTSLPFLRVVVLAFVAVTVLGSAVFGRAWFEQADPFEAWSRLLGLLSPLGRRDDGRWVLRTPLHGVNELRGQPGLVPLVSVMLGSTAYDGFTGNLAWATFAQEAPVPAPVLETATLLGFFVVVGASLALAAAVSARLAGLHAGAWLPLTGDLAPSLVPIAAGYVVAHYWSLWVYQGQLTVALLSNPFGAGDDVLGLAGLTPDATLIRPTLVATIQAVSIVTGHLLGVLAAHERAVTVLPRRAAIVGQAPLVVVMVGYTLGGLTLLFSP